MTKLVPIGQFSKMTRLSVKALRLYHANGMLCPANVDASSGYRYYAPSQVHRAEAVRILRSVDMPLDEILVILESDDPAAVHDRLVAHRERLSSRMAAQQRMLTYLEALIQRNEGIMPYDVQMEDRQPQLIAAIKVRTSLSRIATDIEAGFGALWQGLTGAELTPVGPPLLVYLDEIDEETEGEVEICVPVDRAWDGASALYTRELEGGTMAAAVHRGPYEEIGSAYHALSDWVTQAGHTFAGPPRETYLNDPRTVSPEELLTRVEFPVEVGGG